jgi:hypothetical protein
MIREEEYGRQALALGRHGHRHDGTWWTGPSPFYAKPLFEFRTLVPGTARPSPWRALLGYSHMVPEPRYGNWKKEYMILEGEALRTFGLDRLSGKKRNQVRKGLRSLEVHSLDSVDPYLEEIRTIYISQATRHTEFYDRPDTPPSYYVDHEKEWRERERRSLASCGRRVWGAFSAERLVAFLVCSHIEDTRFIEKMKSHTDFLSACPSDALYFRVLDDAARDPECSRVVNPGLRGQGLNRYKEQFLFRLTAVPVYASRPRLLALAERLAARRPGRRGSSTKRTHA